MKKRPRIKVALSTADKIVELASGAVLLLMWIWILIHYAGLPDIIPIHYNGAGEADGFGLKGNILILPALATVLFAGFTLLNQFPHIFNYPVCITEENASGQYRNMTRMVRYLKLILVAILGFIEFKTIANVHNNTQELGTWFLPLVLAIVIIPLLYFMIKSWNTK